MNAPDNIHLDQLDVTAIANKNEEIARPCLRIDI